MLRDKTLVLMDDTDISGVATTDTLGDNVFDMFTSATTYKRYSDAAAGDPVLLNAYYNDLGRAGLAMLHVAVGSVQLLMAGGDTGYILFRLWEYSTTSVQSGTEVMAVKVPVPQTTATQLVGQYLFGLSLPKELWGDGTNLYIGLSAYNFTLTLSTGKINAWIGNSNSRA